jgi:hypothetical protein
MLWPALRGLTAALAIAALALGGCGGGDEEAEPPTGPLADALAEIGGGGAHGSLGVSWVDPQLVERSGAGGADLMASALGPNAGSLIDVAPRIHREFGFDPLDAERLISVGGSYAFGLRMDGVDGRRLATELVDAGGRSRQAGDERLIEIGSYAVVPDPLLRLDVRGLGAFDAIGADRVVLAISDRARSALLGEGDRLLDEPVYRAAADCLDGSVAVRMIPDQLAIAADLGVNLIAIGVTGDGEILCTLGGTPERADEIATALEGMLAPDARDPVSGERIAKSLTGVEVEHSQYDGVEVVRAEGTAPGARPDGYFLRTVGLGSLARLINGQQESVIPG